MVGELHGLGTSDVLGIKHASASNKGRLRNRRTVIANMDKPKGDPGGKEYAKSDWATKINERSVAKQMPLLSEFPGYREWGAEARRWTRMLYNRP